MLSNLKIENIAVIESASIDFTGRLNCFTGETGAGKSIIIDAINAVLGEKTSRELIRTGASSANVTAFFTDIGKPVEDALKDMDIPSEPDNTLLIRRSILKDGKNICRVNGIPTTVSMLKALGIHLINIHGQSDSQALMSSENHRVFIDKLSENEALLSRYFEYYSELRALKKKIIAIESGEQAKEQRIDMLNYQINELEAAKITVGESENLLNQQKLANNTQNILSALNSAYQTLQGDGEISGACDLVAQATDFLGTAGEYIEDAEAVRDSLYEASILLNDSTSEINSLLSRFEDFGIDLNEIEERLDLLYRLRRKYGSSEAEMLEYLERAKEELTSIQMAYDSLDLLKEEYVALRAKTMDCAEKLSASRQKAAKLFEEEVAAQLRFLDMPNIVFAVKIDRVKLTPTGIDNIEFFISPNAGEVPKPLSKIASGGELSRIMLAIKTVLAQRDDIETLIFDEIDAGVSGRAAGKIALKLKEVASHRQVVCVTHLAQIAAYADNHLFIEKEVRDNMTYTKVESLDFEGRKQELARITSGMDIGDLQLRNAEEMLIGAGIEADIRC